ncbi:MAG: 2OG-Fe(II) oxygenase [Dehalococcoidia bacterium]
MNELTSKDLIYPLPLVSRTLPAAVRIDGFLTADDCARLIEVANRKGFEAITRSRHGQESFVADGCWLRPEDDEQIFRRFAAQAVETNAANWRLALSGIYSPFSVLRYRPGGWIRPHTDTDYRLADTTKLSCIIQLVTPDAFTGGALTIAESETYRLNQGDAVFFPAQTLHSVAPVESGERYVLAAWAQGPEFT